MFSIRLVEGKWARMFSTMPRRISRKYAASFGLIGLSEYCAPQFDAGIGKVPVAKAEHGRAN